MIPICYLKITVVFHCNCNPGHISKVSSNEKVAVKYEEAALKNKKAYLTISAPLLLSSVYSQPLTVRQALSFHTLYGGLGLSKSDSIPLIFVLGCIVGWGTQVIFCIIGFVILYHTLESHRTESIIIHYVWLEHLETSLVMPAASPIGAGSS